MEKHIMRLSEEQRLLGVDVQIIFSGGDPSGPDDCQVLRSVNLRKVRPQALRDFFFYMSVIGLVLRHNLRADVVHIHGDWSAFLFGAIVKYCVRARLAVASVHGATRKSWGNIYKWILNSYQIVMATGARDAAFLRDCGVLGSSWRSSGIDPIYLTRAPRTESFSSDVIIVGNFYPVKNLGFAVDIAHAMPAFKFLFIGDGPELDELRTRCTAEKIENVRFAGRQPSDTVAESLRNAHVFLSTSYSEGTPTAVLEAMACGLPIVTSNSNNYGDLIREGVNGYVIKSFEILDFCQKLGDLLLDEKLRLRIAIKNIEDSKKYGWTEVAKQITDSMCHALDKVGKKP